ncbi:MAG: WYL domain-containing protein [Campylobacteraceae bacterium]|jgi:predicted DNA-binding transcriptional regulator YafY|nr:WYL domain-containing protein [Campylobacteraceae bacterium]
MNKSDYANTNMEYKNRVSRLAYILTSLSKGQSVSTPSLVKFFGKGITKKMVQTDLKEYIFPLFIDKKIYYDYTYKVYRAKDNFLVKTLFTADELAIIAILKNKSKDKYSDNDLSKRVDTMFNKFEDELSNKLYQKSSIEKIDDFRDEIIQIKNAIETKHIIKCFYKNKNRTIYPLKILNLEGYWYLIIYEPMDDLIKTFHLNSVKNIECTNDTYNFDQNIIDSFDSAITAYFEPNNKPITVELLISKEVSKYFERKPLNKTQRLIRELPDKSIELEIIITDLMEIIPTIQRYIPYVFVINPKELACAISKNISVYKNSVGEISAKE